MKRYPAFIVSLIILALTGAATANDTWTDDYETAVARAKTESKVLLLNFSGSDWCGWCIRLDKEVFSQDAFQAYAEENLICVTLDFPRNQDNLSIATRQQNQRLMEKYRVRGFPTILLLDPEEHTLAKTGYQPGGAETYVKHLDALLKPHQKMVPPSESSPQTGTSSE